MEVFDHVATLLPKDIPLDIDIQNFEALHDPHTREALSYSALNSDIVAFALSEDRPIADSILKWTKKWLSLKEDYSSALVGILVNPEIWPLVPPNSSNIKRLQSVVDTGHQVFLTQELFQTDLGVIQNN